MNNQKQKLNELHLFAGGGGGILGGMLLGHTTVCAVEIEPYCRKVLIQRQRDGILPRFPIWDDVRTFDGKPWRGKVDVVCGGFPCQDISCAGKGAGINGARSGMWVEMARIIREVSPRFVFVENSPMLTSRGLGRVLGDLAEMGYDARWGVFSAADAASRHERSRIWIVADSMRDRLQRITNPRGFGEGWKERAEQLERLHASERAVAIPSRGNLGVTDGVANRMDRLKAIGNGQVPVVAALAWNILGGGS